MQCFSPPHKSNHVKVTAPHKNAATTSRDKNTTPVQPKKMSEDHYKRYEGFDFPLTKLLLRTKEGTECFVGPPSIIPPPTDPAQVTIIKPDKKELSQPNTPLRIDALYSPNGALLARVPDDKSAPIEVTNANEGEVVCLLPCTDAQYIDFSPLGTFLVSWSRQIKPKPGESPQSNLHVWRVATGERVASFSQRQLQPNMIQWNRDESVCIRLVSNEVHVCNGSAPGVITQKVYHKGVTQCGLSPNPDVHVIAVFTPEVRGKHAKLALFNYDKNICNNASLDAKTSPACTDTNFGRSMFAATECSMKWNFDGHFVLVQTQSDVDSSNASYYGSTGLFLISVDGKVCCKVPQSKEGHVAAAEWAPEGDFFIMAAGSMPCQVTMFSKTGEAIYEFGAMHRNTICFAPHGRFLCLAGFGNLAGDMDFYDFSGNKKKKIGSANSHCAIKWGWSPDSRYFMTATLRPRMNVDNGVKIFKYNGDGGAVIKHDEYLYDAQWQPSAVSTYPDRSRSPSRGGKAAGSEKAAPEKPTSVGAYRPPGSSGMLSDMMKRSAGPKGKIVGSSNCTNKQAKPSEKSAGVATQRTIPGLPVPSMAAGSSGSGTKKSRNRKKSSQSASSTEESMKEDKIDTSTAVDTDKKIKNLRKKLKQVQELKDKQQSGVEMNADQLKKIDSEKDILHELSQLER